MAILYTPPTLTKAEELEAVKVGTKIHNLHDLKKRVYYIIAIVAENKRLVKQVNELRTELGYPLMPVKESDETRIG